ncbi:hypothetical protein OHV05_14705 [Kitasatospora sp. NBC_00070]|uniref:hypothetical protein n=1 Tax=Kitasatospora sp. NBC_00070 TaxID=2975962 RepID=UPI00324B79C8
MGSPVRGSGSRRLWHQGTVVVCVVEEQEGGVVVVDAAGVVLDVGAQFFEGAVGVRVGADALDQVGVELAGVVAGGVQRSRNRRRR